MGEIYILGPLGGADTAAVTASAADVLNPKVIVDKSGKPLVGTMINRGAWNGNTGYEGVVTIPEGYHNGKGKVTGGPFSFSGNAGTADVLSGRTFYSDSGTKQTGTMVNRGAWNGSTSYGGSVTIPAGYHNGSGKVTGGAFSFSGNAAAWQVLKGATFYSDSGTRQTGSMYDYRGGNMDYERLTTEGNDYPGRFQIKMINNGCFNANSYVSCDLAYMLSTLVSSSAAKSDNVIRKGPSTSYSENAYYYTGRTGGSNGRWHEVIVYGWQYY